MVKIKKLKTTNVRQKQIFKLQEYIFLIVMIFHSITVLGYVF